MIRFSNLHTIYFINYALYMELLTIWFFYWSIVSLHKGWRILPAALSGALWWKLKAISKGTISRFLNDWRYIGQSRNTIKNFTKIWFSLCMTYSWELYFQYCKYRQKYLTCCVRLKYVMISCVLRNLVRCDSASGSLRI